MKNSKDLLTQARKFYENKNFFEAKSNLLKVIEDKNLDKMFRLSLYVLISDVCYKVNDFQNSEKYLLKAINNGKVSADIFNSLGNIYLKKRDYKNSEKFYLESIKFDEKNEIALINLAIFYHNLGNTKKAISLYTKILKINPKNIGALYNLSNIKKSVIDEKTIEVLKKMISNKNQNVFDIASSYFILANFEKNKKNFNKEIKFLVEANKFAFRINEKKNINLNQFWLYNIPYNIKKVEYLQNEKKLPNTNDIHPIFIVGLPRSGSTLIESIISSGDIKIDNLGETNLVNWALLNSNHEFSKLSNNKQKIDINLNEFSKKLNNSFKNLKIKKNQEKIIFSEKSLENFYYIEMILKIFPNAKFIHSHRNIIDNVFAIYKQFLPKISWSHSLENILTYIENYTSILKYFKKKYPDKILSVSLESFTDNPKKVSMEIFKFCKLKWSKKCLDFYKRDNLFINTASNNQMRSGVKNYNHKKYDSYKHLLNIYIGKYDWLNTND